MAANTKIDSNITGLAYAEEASPKVLPGTAIWVSLEPNGYPEFGGQVTTVARNPINPSRQRKKGVVVDLEASAGFSTDLTPSNMQDLLQGFFFADLRRKGEGQNPIGGGTLGWSVNGTTDRLTVENGPDLTTQFAVGDLVRTKGFVQGANNGVFYVTAVAATTLDLALANGAQGNAPLVTEGSNTSASVVQVGFETATGDLDVDASGDLPALTSTTLNFTTLGLVPGEWIFIGGDAAALKFANAANSGFARVRTIEANRLTLDKTQNTMVTEANTTLQVHLYVGRVLKNEAPALIKKRTYQLERTLGKADDTDPNDQSEYVIGAQPNELTLNYTTGDKITMDLSFVGLDHELRNGATGPKAGIRVPVVEADAFNTSSDVSRVKLALVKSDDANPEPLFAFATEITLTLNNNVAPNKAISVLGAFATSAGTFQVGGSITAYFASIAAVQAVRDNADVTMDFHMVKDNTGISIDVPLVSLGEGRANVELDQPIMLPLGQEAASGAKVHANLDHTLLMVFWDYLPDLADV